MSESIVQAGEVNFDRIYQLVLDKAIEVFGVDRASIMNFDPERGFLKIVASRGLPNDVVLRTRVKPGEGVSGRVFQEAKPILVETKPGREPSYKSDSFISAPMLCSPMRMGETCVGVINITERRDRRPFEERDLKLLTTLANQAASYLRIGHLIEQVKESQKLEQELLWARRIERSLLPHGACKLPEAEVYGQCEMAKHVGGDYFDYIEEGPYLYLVVADVSGHNLPAALTMVNFRSLLRSQIGLGGAPAAILRKVNAWIYRDLAANEQQITVALLRLDREKRVISYANAGHPPVLYVKKGEREIERWKGDGILLGALPDAEYEELTRTWAALDAILCYTDGVVEACNRSRTPFGEKALAALLSKYRDLTPKTLVPLIFKGLHRHMEGRTVDDDLTLMCAILK
jgi:sigma-B regulation protein RsbU (phosphoserine phosphatase)